MNKLALAGILHTYAMNIAACGDNKEQVIKIIKRVKEELNIAEIRREWEPTNEQNRRKVV